MVEFLVSLIINLFSSQLYDGTIGLVRKFKLKKF